MRCGKCGSENSEGNRFCGMCGATLVAKPLAASPASPSADPFANPRAPAAASPVPSAVEPRRTFTAPQIPQPPVSRTPDSSPPVMQRPSAPPQVRQVPNQAPVAQLPSLETPTVPAVRTERTVYDPGISGPSFLGLNQPTARHTWEENDEHGAPSPGNYDSDSRYTGSADYLLDDEEPRRGWGKLAALVVALLLAGGFGYLHWRQGGFDWLMQAKTTAPAASTTGDASGTPGAAAPSDTTNANPPLPTAASPESTTGNAAPPANNTPSGNAADSGAQGNPPNGTASTSAADSSTPQNLPAASRSSDSASSTGSSEKPAETEAASESNDNADAEAATPASKPKPEVSRKAIAREPKPSPATAVDPTAEAERYIYGRGVRQDCDRGLQLLKPAAAQANPQAMIMLGGLYSSGTCTPRDLPTAYRWFALALHKQPDNQILQSNVQRLWGQMTQPERQLAIRLSH